MNPELSALPLRAPGVRTASAAMLLLLAASAPLAAQPRPAPFKLGVVSFYNPRLMYLKYQPLVDYLSASSGTTWELAISGSFERTVEALCAGDVALAYLGPFTYLRAQQRCGATVLARLATGGRAHYSSLIMVRRDSPIRSLADLAGKRFAFGAPLSTSSHLVPRGMLLEAGLRPGQDVSCQYFQHHERAARAVLLGQAEACGVRDLVGRKFEERGLRVIAQSAPIPNFPLVLSPHASNELRQTLLEVLLERPRRDAAVAARMAAWDEELARGFAPAAPSDYLSLLRLAERVFGAGVLSRPEEELLCATWAR